MGYGRLPCNFQLFFWTILLTIFFGVASCHMVQKL